MRPVILTFTETAMPVLADASHNPVFFAATGEFTGTVSGVSTAQGHEDKVRAKSNRDKRYCSYAPNDNHRRGAAAARLVSDATN